MQTGSGNGQFMAEINVTPFVDVMLVLLIIFMVTAPMMVQGIDVNLPKATAKALKGSEERLIVSIDNEMKVYINEQVVSVEFLAQKLVAILANLESKDVYLKADKQVPYGVVVNVISKIKTAGVDSLGMITLPDNEDKS
ncbi:MAG: protein TolR [Desulfobacterales bacterium RIFOXYA12_FULL_46_15]|nr:MAG: protein TolR [Desulfobacula sp. GWF2_41_7]OGR26883.1 MAG: protein TolR [Desulfobacterales bacterium RIFOXYA12_FULL_46_15]